MLYSTELRPNKKRGQNAISLVYATAACFIISTLAEIISNYTSEGFVIGVTAILRYLYSGVSLVSAVLFIMWFRRAYYNLNVAAHNTIYSDGWVAAFWFIPIVNFFKPYSIMREMYESTNNLIAEDIKGCVIQKPLSNINTWWTLWVSYYLLGIIIGLIFRDSAVVIEIYQFVQIGIFIALTFYTVKVVRDYMEMEEVMQEMAETQREGEMQRLGES